MLISISDCAGWDGGRRRLPSTLLHKAYAHTTCTTNTQILINTYPTVTLNQFFRIHS
jgi:hypothetical protein